MSKNVPERMVIQNYERVQLVLSHDVNNENYLHSVREIELLSHCVVGYFHHILEMFSCLCSNLLHKLIMCFQVYYEKAVAPFLGGLKKT